MTREEIILSHIKRHGLGLEIGAGCAPIAPKKQGFRVHVLDHCDRKALIEKYRPHGINVDNIEEVDFVWDGRSYTELVGRRHVYDCHPPQGSEFYITLSRQGHLPEGARLELLGQILREQSAA
jgi:hypothetical protein